MRAFLTAAAVQGIVFTHTHTPSLKMDENVIKKLNWVLPNETSKIRTKSFRHMVCALKDYF